MSFCDQTGAQRPGPSADGSQVRMTASISVVLSAAPVSSEAEGKDLMPFQPADRRNRHEILRSAQDDDKGSPSDSICNDRWYYATSIRFMRVASSPTWAVMQVLCSPGICSYWTLGARYRYGSGAYSLLVA